MPSTTASTSVSRSVQRASRADSAARAAAGHRLRQAHRRSGREVRVRRHLLDLHDAEHVRSAEAEHPLHARERGEHVDVVAQLVEHLPTPLGALVHELQPELVVADHVHEQQ